MTQVERGRRLREAKRGKAVPAGVKHGMYAYKVYRCRCNTCSAAAAEQRAQLKHAWRKTARGRWVDGPKVTVLCWPPKDAGPDWSCPECGPSREKEAL